MTTLSSRPAPCTRSVDLCSFCEELRGSEAVSSPLIRSFFAEFGRSSRVLLEGETAFVVPSLGPLVPGHILVLPKSHYFSIGEIPESDLSEFQLIAEESQGILSKVYGCCSAFEHGCIERVGRAGACIDHAHLHLIPLTKDLRALVEGKFGHETPVKSLADLRVFFERKVPYLYYQAPDRKRAAYEAAEAPTQFFRQLVFATTVCRGNWDWKEDLRTPLVKETYSALRALFLELENRIYAPRP